MTRKLLITGLCALLLGVPAQAADTTADEMNGSVARAQFTSNVSEREPVDRLGSVPNTTETVYFFTELRDFSGQTVTHRWLHDGEVVAEVPFSVGGPRWRVWSSKNLMPEWTGTWTVEVVDGLGQVVHSETLEVTAAGSAPAAEKAAQPEPAPEAEAEAAPPPPARSG